jgi:very-short-patch-repair endonuclease
VDAQFAGKIQEYLRTKGPAKAKEIADALGIDRKIVNSVCYGCLRGKVTQDRNYRWSSIDAAQAVPSSRKNGGRKTASENSRATLFGYYLDCLSEDEDSGVSVFADSRFDLDYAELGEWPFEAEQPVFGAEPVRKLVNEQHLEPRKKSLWLGYPALLHRVQSRNGWVGNFLEPLLLWPQDVDANGPAFLTEPLLNSRALTSLPTTSGNELEEAALLAEELGLDSPYSTPLDELTARLRDLRPEWPWKEALAPEPFRGPGELQKIQEPGIYNAAVVVLADRPGFTLGLERELADLKTVDDADLDRSALGTLLGAKAEASQWDGPLLEPAPLNMEQRSAVRSALTEPLTVITGPPGTGKSQVVTAVLVNAAWRGLRVLFASKNNKAVDVVTERMNSLTSHPILLRMGNRDYQNQLVAQITALLASKPTESDRLRGESALAELKERAAALEGDLKASRAVVELRNEVDGLERSAEEARGVLPEEIFCNAARLDTSAALASLADLRAAADRADRRHAFALARLFWPLLRKKRERLSKEAAERTAEVLKPLGLVFVPSDGPEMVHTVARDYLARLSTAALYQTKLAELSTAPNAGELARRIARQTMEVAGASKEVWEYWCSLLPERLTKNDRSALGDYVALLQLILGTQETGGSVQRQVWGRYYGLATRIAKVLPCWAVTSLSARGRVPFLAADFDLLVIDEASQCDIASALPLLFRCKRAAVIGDPQQLRHISKLSKRRDQALMVKHGILDVPGPNWAYGANSFYDLASAKAETESIVDLRDHHRSHADIIDFSNEFFYGGRLRVATDYRRLKRPKGLALRWVDVRGKVVRPARGGAVNEAEAEAVVAELRRIAVEQRFVGEIGVVSPFRAQANRIRELILRDNALAAVLASRNFISETAHGFQGDERDLILFSPVVSAGTPQTAAGFLKSQGNIFNVGITRARGSLVVVGDKAACSSCDIQYLKAFASYVSERGAGDDRRETPCRLLGTGREYPAVARPELVSNWEKVLYAALVDAGVRTIPQYDIDRYTLDLAFLLENGRRLDIEVDGEHYHRDWDGELLRRDQLRNLRLIEMGWDVLRFWVYEVRDDLPGCVARVKDWLAAADQFPSTI